jgi:hypothetical protein
MSHSLLAGLKAGTTWLAKPILRTQGVDLQTEQPVSHANKQQSSYSKADIPPSLAIPTFTMPAILTLGTGFIVTRAFLRSRKQNRALLRQQNSRLTQKQTDNIIRNPKTAEDWDSLIKSSKDPQLSKAFQEFQIDSLCQSYLSGANKAAEVLLNLASNRPEFSRTIAFKLLGMVQEKPSILSYVEALVRNCPAHYSSVQYALKLLAEDDLTILPTLHSLSAFYVENKDPVKSATRKAKAEFVKTVKALDAANPKSLARVKLMIREEMAYIDAIGDISCELPWYNDSRFSFEELQTLHSLFDISDIEFMLANVSKQPLLAELLYQIALTQPKYKIRITQSIDATITRSQNIDLRHYRENYEAYLVKL